MKSLQRVPGCSIYHAGFVIVTRLLCQEGTAVATVGSRSSDCRGGAHPHEGQLDDDLTGQMGYRKSWREHR